MCERVWNSRLGVFDVTQQDVEAIAPSNWNNLQKPPWCVTNEKTFTCEVKMGCVQFEDNKIRKGVCANLTNRQTTNKPQWHPDVYRRGRWLFSEVVLLPFWSLLRHRPWWRLELSSVKALSSATLLPLHCCTGSKGRSFAHMQKRLQRKPQKSMCRRSPVRSV